MDYHFKNLIMEGGGVKGIAYVGALETLEELGILQNITRVGGTSTGAIQAVLLGLGFSVDEIAGILWSMNFSNFLDDSWGVIRDTHRLIHDYGWYKGNFFRKWVAQLIAIKAGNTEATFADVHKQASAKGFRDMYFTGTNLSTRYCEVFSYEHTPRMCIADAVRISMSIPLFFSAVRIGPRDDVYVDGGVLSNYPVKIFDRQKYASSDAAARPTKYYQEHNQQLLDEGRNVSAYIYNKETLGFRLDSAEEIAVFRDHSEPPVYKINDFFTYIRALIETVTGAQQNIHLHSDDWQRTIYIDTLGVKTTDFDIDDDTKHSLVASGRRGVRAYFSWYDKTRTVNDLYGTH